jgi:hypothetical protein
MRLEIGQLPIAVGSPAAPVKEQDGVLAGEIPRETKRPAIHYADFVLGKRIANV